MSTAFVWIPMKYVDGFLSAGIIRLANLSYYQQLENGAIGIGDKSEGNQINLNQVKLEISAPNEGMPTSISAPILYQGCASNDIYIYSISHSVSLGFANLMLSYPDMRRCIKIDNFQELFARICSAFGEKFGDPTVLCDWGYIKYKQQQPNSIYHLDSVPPPREFVFRKDTQFADQNEIRFAFFTKRSKHTIPKTFSYDRAIDERIIETGPLNALCEDITDEIKTQNEPAKTKETTL